MSFYEEHKKEQLLDINIAHIYICIHICKQIILILSNIHIHVKIQNICHETNLIVENIISSKVMYLHCIICTHTDKRFGQKINVLKDNSIKNIEIILLTILNCLLISRFYVQFFYSKYIIQ